MIHTNTSATLLDLSYGYDRGNSIGSLSGKTGQLTRITNNLDHNKDRSFEYDALGRLTAAKGGLATGATGVTANWIQTYAYDRYGNRTSVTPSGVTADSNAVPSDGLTSLGFDTSSNRINSSGWQYDNAGNLIRGQNQSGTWLNFEYDAAGRLVKVKDDSTPNNVLETYTYGADRNRLINETTTGRTYYAWGGSSVIQEYREPIASSIPVYSKSYVYAGSRLLSTATVVSGTEVTEFHHPDRLGTKLVTNPSANTNFEQSTLPFGTELTAEEAGTGSTNQKFTSYDRSAGTGLDYAVNRTHSPGQSRFTQSDPLGFGSTSRSDPQSFNLYSFVQNEPVNFIDPSGLLIEVFYHEECQVDGAWLLETGEVRYSSCQLVIDDILDIPDGPIGPGDPGVSGGGGAGPGAPSPGDNCGINPITGQPGLNTANSGVPGQLRPGAGSSGQGYFGARRNGGRSHLGDDISAPGGTPVFSFAPGRIVSVSGSASSTKGYGLMITVDHGGGYTSRYAHLSDSLGERSGSTAGGTRYAGQIGLSGQSGNASGQASTEAHLHFEIRLNGKPLDPAKFLNSPCPKGFNDYQPPS